MYEDLLKEAQKNGWNVGICAKIVNEKSQVLLVRRDASDTYSGIWEMPGGAVDPGESPEQALVREVREETNLHVDKIIKYIGYFNFDNVETKKKKRKFCFAVLVSGNVALSNDHGEFKWFTQSEVGKLRVEGKHKDYQIWQDHYKIISQSD